MKIKKILIFGAEGMLGREFTDHFKKSELFKVIGANQNLADITNFDEVQAVIKKNRPDIIINCAALVNVDYCENKPLAAWKVNAIGAGHIVGALNKLDFLKTIVFQISTSDIFGNLNKKKFGENDIPLPVNVYGWSKLGGERIIQAEAKIKKIKYFIVRTSWLYSEYRETFVDFAVRSLLDKKYFSVISDQYNVITWTKDLVQACHNLIEHNSKYASGIYHLTNRSKTKLSKYKIALKIAEILKIDKKYCKPELKGKILKTVRPECAFLDNNKIIKLPDWEVSLRNYLKVFTNLN